jgi:hypothetical protein
MKYNWINKWKKKHNLYLQDLFINYSYYLYYSSYYDRIREKSKAETKDEIYNKN